MRIKSWSSPPKSQIHEYPAYLSQYGSLGIILGWIYTRLNNNSKQQFKTYSNRVANAILANDLQRIENLRRAGRLSERMFVEICAFMPVDFSEEFLKMRTVQAQGLFSIDVNHNILNNDLVNKLSETLNCFDTSVSWRSVLLSMFICLRLLWKHFGDIETMMLAVTNFLISLNLSDEVYQFLHNFAFNGVKTVDAQSFEISDYLDITKILQWSGGLISAIIVSLILKVVPGCSSFDTWLNRFSKMSGVIKSNADVQRVGSDWINAIVDTVKVKLFGMDSEKVDEWEHINKWFMESTTLIPGFERNLREDPKIKQLVDVLFERGLNICKTLDSLKIPHAQRDHISKMMLFLASARDKASNVDAGQIALRVPPSIVHFYGNSGVGKSSLLACLTADIQAALGVIDPNDFNMLTYYRQPGRDFWDGYRNGVNVVVCDDFGAVRDTEGNPNEEFLEAIRMSNTASYMLNMADLKDKGQTYFNAKAVIWTSNQSLFDCKSLTNYEAVLRRVSLKFRQKPHPDFSKKQLQKGVLVDVLDNTKIKPLLTNDKFGILKCILFDLEGTHGGLIEANLTFEQMRDMVVSTILNNKSYHEDFNEIVADYASTAVARYAKAQFFGGGLPHINLVKLPFDNCKVVESDDWSHADKDLYDAVCVRRHDDGFLEHYQNAYYTALMTGSSVEQKRQIFSNIMYSYDGEYEICDECTGEQNEYNCHKTFWQRQVQTFEDMITRLKSFNKVTLVITTILSGVLMFLSYKFVRSLYSKFFKKKEDFSGLVVKDVEQFYSQVDKTPKVKVSESRSELDKSNKTKRVEMCDRCMFQPPEFQCSSESRNELDKSRLVKNVESRNELDKTRVVKQVESRNDMDKTLPMKKVEFAEFEKVTSAQAVTDKNAAEIVAKLFRSLYKLESYEDGEWIHNMNLLVIKGRLAIVNKHVLSKENVTMWRIRNAHKPEGIQFNLMSLPRGIIPDEDIHGKKDVMMVELPRIVEQHPDLTSKFMTVNDFSRFQSLKSVSLVGYLPSEQVMLRQYFSDRVRAVDSAIAFQAKNFISYCRQYFEYGIQTVSGDCGGALVAFDSNFNNKIFGIHAGGEEGTVYTGFGTPVTQQILAKLEKCLSIEHLCSLQYPAEIAEEELKVTGKVDNEEIHWSLNLPFVGNFMYLGSMLKKAYQAVDSQITPSPIHGVICEPTMKPAFLKPFKDGDVIVDPMAKARAKASPAPFQMDEELLDNATLHFTQMVTSDISEKDRRVLSFEEAITGVDGDDMYAGINRGTSPGYGWVKTGVGKTKWLGDSDYVVDNPEVVAKYKQLLKQCKTNRPTTIWCDTLKDERRPIAKVNQGKTRLFSVGEMCYTILFRQYFMGFIAHMMRHKIDFESCVGVNVYSRDWTKLGTAISTVGDKVIAGDFGNYDGTLNAELLWRVLDVVEAFYEGTEEERQIRRSLWSEIVYSIHLNDGNVYSWTHSQPSGCPMTTILNCCYHSISARYVFLLCALRYKPTMASLKNYTKLVRHFNYGDDDIWNISDEIIEWFNQVTISEAYATFGMEYTDEAKTGEIVPFRSINEINFLKRVFRWDAVQNRYRAPLALETIREMAMWNRKTVDPYQLTSDVLQEAVHELAQHDRVVFDRELPNFERARKIINNVTPCFFETYEAYQRVEYAKYVEEA